MSQHNQVPSEGPKRSIVFLAGGLIVILILGAIGSWYLFGVARHAGPAAVTLTSIASLTNMSTNAQTEGLPQETPEGIPEEDAPGTPAPGFSDNFDSGLSPAWTVLYGDALISQGQLTSRLGAGLAAGDASWENYQIDFDVDTSQVACSFVDTSNSVGVRVRDFDHAYWFVFTNCNAAWSLFAGGVDKGASSLFQDTTVNTAKGKKHITIKVEETKMSAYENNSRLSAIIDTSFRTGGIFLQVEAQTYYDNFQITLLP